MTTTVGSLCFGVGGLDAGLGRADPNAEVSWYAENNDDAATVAAKRFPGVHNAGDITTVRWSELPPVDVIAAGFPCQPISAAGRQRADTDHRWLWPHVRDAIEEIRPARVVLENVQNITAIQSGAILAGILADLRAAGYAARWTVVGACAVGAPHHRHRWYLIADAVTGMPAPAAVRVGAKAHCGAPRSGGRALLPTPCTADGAGGPGCPGREGGDNLRTAVLLLPTHERGRGNLEPWGRFADAVALWEELTGVAAPEPTEAAPRGGRRLNPLLSEWMMGLGTGWVTDDMPRGPALRLIGNAVVPDAAAAAYRLLTREGLVILPRL